MKLSNLSIYKDSDGDSIIFDYLNRSSGKEILAYISNVTSDLLNAVCISSDFKENAKLNLSKYTENEIGHLSTYICIIPYVQLALSSKNPSWTDKVNHYLEYFIGFIVGTISKDEFLSNLLEMKEVLSLSNKFHDGLITFFEKNTNTIVDTIFTKLNF